MLKIHKSTWVILLPVALLTLSCSRSTTLSGVSSDGGVTLEWAAPSANNDDSPLTDLAGYKIRYGTEPGVYAVTADAGNVTSYQVQNLERGKTYYFTVTAVNTTGNESAPSNELSKKIE